jgi:hypothetical protein
MCLFFVSVCFQYAPSSTDTFLRLFVYKFKKLVLVIFLSPNRIWFLVGFQNNSRIFWKNSVNDDGISGYDVTSSYDIISDYDVTFGFEFIVIDDTVNQTRWFSIRYSKFKNPRSQNFYRSAKISNATIQTLKPSTGNYVVHWAQLLIWPP